MRNCGWTDGRTGGDGMGHIQEFLTDHYLTRGRGKAISTATASDFPPAPARYRNFIRK